MSGIAASTMASRVAYRRVLRPLLFRYAGGDPEAVHEAMIHGLARLPATSRATVSILRRLGHRVEEFAPPRSFVCSTSG